MASKREVVNIPGLAHGAPIPNGAKIGNMVFSSAISGRDTETGKLPEEPDRQAEALFRNIRTFMKNAGGTPDNIAHMTVFLKEEKLRDSINKEWVKMFPDEKDRPARHAVTGELRGGMLFQVELVAVL
ncbi:MAG: RidA family protein [Deltaproteobacteria bacterium]|nr:RidA family protein [Deltaproteobacteria bacterium]